MSTTEVRQKIPVPRRSFLWSLNETSGEILMHVGPTEFTPSANDRIVRSNDRGGFESAPMEARPFVMAKDGEYVVLSNPVKDAATDDTAKNGAFIAGGNKEKELVSGTKRIIPGPCSFPLWPGQSAEVRPAHKLGANQYLLVEVVGDVEERAPYYRLVIESAGLSSAVIDQGGEAEAPSAGARSPGAAGDGSLRLGQRIVIQGRHTQLFIPPSGIEIVPPVEDQEPKEGDTEDAIAQLPPSVVEECVKLVALVREGVSQKQFSTLKSEIRHRQDLTIGHRAIVLSALDQAFEARPNPGKRVDRDRRATGPTDPYARRAVVLGPKEFCILFDADGNPRIVRGPARVFPGPHDTFLQRGSRRRVYDAYELAEHQALWLRIITPISRERLAKHLPPGFPLEREDYEAGAELVVRGRPSVFFPFIEAEVVNPITREPHVGNDHDSVIIDAIGVDPKSGIYVRDLRTGVVSMVRGETSHLVDPRSQEHVRRRVTSDQWALWVDHAQLVKAKGADKAAEPTMVSSPWALSIAVPNGEACLVASRHGRRVEVGPKVFLLEYEEELAPVRLSKGPSKDGHVTVTTAFLRVAGGRTADTFELESSDFVKLRVKLGFTGRFEGEPERWFSVDDPVKLLADHVRAAVRAAVRELPLAKVARDASKIVKQALFGAERELRFEECGMVVDSCEVLKLDIVDPALAEAFSSAQRDVVKLQIADEQAARRLESERLKDVIDAEEHAIVRAAVTRRAESQVVDAESEHRVELTKLQLRYAAGDVELDRARAQAALRLREELEAAERRTAAQAERRKKEAEGDALASEAVYRVEEAHLAKVAALELERARALAEAEAIRLQAIQPELVGALHAAADAEVMKAAAANMNLVSLLGGKSPQELFEHVLRGTPLERTTRDMRERSKENGHRVTQDPGDGE